MNMKRVLHGGHIGSTLVLLSLGGCAPHMVLQVAPEVLSSEWSITAPPPRAEQSIALGQPVSLGTALHSPELAELIVRAKTANADVAIAAARIQQARAQLRRARSAMLPVFGGSIGGTIERGSAPPAAGAPISRIFDFTRAFDLNLTFDPDIFGRNHASSRASGARLEAAVYDRRTVLLVVEADVALTYVQAAALLARIELRDRSIVQARELQRIIGARRAAGDASQVDVGLQSGQVQRLLTDRVRLVEALDRTRTAMAVLLGEEAPAFRLPTPVLASLHVSSLPAVRPADLVFRRPDLIAAEARIVAAGGDVEAARAAFLPRLSLSSSAAAQAATGGPLTAILSVGANMLAPIFNRGRLRGDFDLATAQQRESVEQYRQTLLASLAEVENALSATSHSETRERLLTDVVEQAQLTSRLARLQYVEGDADVRWVFTAERYLVSAEDAHALALQERLEAAIGLYRSIGGTIVGPSRFGAGISH